MLTFHHIMGVILCLGSVWFGFEMLIDLLDFDGIGFVLSFTLFSILFCMGYVFIQL